jgi:hypothetical protein
MEAFISDVINVPAMCVQGGAKIPMLPSHNK